MTLEQIDPTGDVVRWATLIGPAASLAEKIANTDFVPKAMRDNPAVVTAAILYGDEIGIGPMQALNSIHVVEGRPQPSAELMRALILRAGHYFTVHEATGTRVRVSGIRQARPETERVTVEWTLDMARAAGLMGKKNWQTHPRAMLMARATGDLARWLFPDVIKGLGYVAEDVALEPPELEEEAPAPEPRKAIQRKKRPTVPAPREPADDAPAPTPTPEPEEPTRPAPAPPVAPPVYAPEDVALPDPEPESPAPEPPPDDGPPSSISAIGPGMLRALHAALTRELGTVATREEKLAMCRAIIGRPIESSKSLTRDDGAKCLDVLGRIASGAVSWEFDPAGKPDDPIVVIHDAQ